MVTTNNNQRQEVINKIKSILQLQNGTNFEAEATAAAEMIDKLCTKYGVTLDEAVQVIALDEEFTSFKNMNFAYVTLLDAVAKYYDASLYILQEDGKKSIKIIGSEAQQIQVKLYHEFFMEVMEKESELAYNAEKALSELTGSSINRGFKINFKKAFAVKVAERLKENKINENRVHQDADIVKNKLATMRFSMVKGGNGATGGGAAAGSNVGSNVSLNRQATGASSHRALTGAS